ncbi:hypothetical protein DAI21_20385 [Lelliottia sp. WB101]|nr:hypothetical protein DAI21_20385 [Lelliottia sp. WB101]
MIMRDYCKPTKQYIGSDYITFVEGQTMSGNIAAQVCNQGGIDFGNGTIKLSEYPTSNKSAKFDNKYQKFYHFYLPEGYADNVADLNVINIDDDNAKLFGIG